MICFISSSNPISSIRSASSMTRAFRFLKTKPFVFCAPSEPFEIMRARSPVGGRAAYPVSRRSG